MGFLQNLRWGGGGVRHHGLGALINLHPYPFTITSEFLEMANHLVTEVVFEDKKPLFRHVLLLEAVTGASDSIIVFRNYLLQTDEAEDIKVQVFVPG